jgi:hypothetical protein
MSFKNTTGKFVLSLGCLVLGSGCLKANVTYGAFNAGNCIPFMCNDSGTSAGESIDYEQVYAAGGFSGTTTITGIDFYLDAAASGSNVDILGGGYAIYWGYAALNSVGNLSGNLANYIGAKSLFTFSNVSPGGFAYGSVLHFTGSSFTYNPALGNLLLEVVVDDQDNVGNATKNGFNEADTTGTVTSRAYCITNGACGADNGGLVTTFDTAAPEPGTLGMLGGALFGLSLLRKRFS